MSTEMKTETAQTTWGSQKTYDKTNVETKRKVTTKAATEKDCENCPYIKLILEEVFKHVDKLDKTLELYRDGRPTDAPVDNEVN